MKKIALVLFFTLLFTGCAVNRFNGVWEGEMMSVGGDQENVQCGEGVLSLDIKNGQVEGVAKISYGYELSVSGTINENGKIEGQLLGDDDAEVFFFGELMEKDGGGTWNDRMNCFGTFWVAKK